ncbi:MAG: amidohydrolase family protein [Chloroflexi bacterium]|nr:amidohydrolase family protein [Chloroflexota bacterium]
MKNGFRVLDSDMHVVEPPDLWQRYIAPAFRERAPVGLLRFPRDFAMVVDGRSLGLAEGNPMRIKARDLTNAQKDERYAFAIAQGWDSHSQLKAMDAEGIDLAVMFPSRGLFVLGLDSTETAGEAGITPPYAAAIARAYNDWMRDFCAVDRKRMFGAGMIAPHDIEGSASEVRRCVRDLGFKAMFTLPGCVNKRPWHHAAYDPLWAACQEADVPIVFHGGGRDHLSPDFTLEVLEYVSMWHTFSHPLGPMMALVSLTAGAVFERFPRLRAAFLEGNCSWAPWLFYRLDDLHEWRGRYEVPALKAKPSEYFKRHCYISVEADESPVKWAVEAVGDENIVFSTDYPHADAKFPYAVEKVQQLPVSKESMRKFLWDNCARLYKLEGRG